MYQPPNSPNVQSTIAFVAAPTACLVASLELVRLPIWAMAIGLTALFVYEGATSIKLQNPNQTWGGFILVVITGVVSASMNTYIVLIALSSVAFVAVPRVVAWRRRAALKALPSYCLGQLAWLVTHLDPSVDHIVHRTIAGGVGYLSRWYYLNAKGRPFFPKKNRDAKVSQGAFQTSEVTVRRSLFVALILCVAATTGCATRAQKDNQPLKPTTTYLYLLRHTPFFVGLNDDQLRWVIRRSREWEVQAGTVIVSSDSSHDGDGVWVLLDGRWTLEAPDRNHASGPADAGMWFNRDLVSTSDFKLLANSHSYVMQISSKDMDEMLARGFRFETRLAEGTSLYRRLNEPQEGTSKP